MVNLLMWEVAFSITPEYASFIWGIYPYPIQPDSTLHYSRVAQCDYNFCTCNLDNQPRGSIATYPKYPEYPIPKQIQTLFQPTKPKRKPKPETRCKLSSKAETNPNPKLTLSMRLSLNLRISLCLSLSKRLDPSLNLRGFLSTLGCSIRCSVARQLRSKCGRATFLGSVSFNLSAVSPTKPKQTRKANQHVRLYTRILSLILNIS